MRNMNSNLSFIHLGMACWRLLNFTPKTNQIKLRQTKKGMFTSLFLNVLVIFLVRTQFWQPLCRILICSDHLIKANFSRLLCFCLVYFFSSEFLTFSYFQCIFKLLQKFPFLLLWLSRKPAGYQYCLLTEIKNKTIGKKNKEIEQTRDTIFSGKAFCVMHWVFNILDLKVLKLPQESFCRIWLLVIYFSVCSWNMELNYWSVCVPKLQGEEAVSQQWWPCSPESKLRGDRFWRGILFIS